MVEIFKQSKIELLTDVVVFLHFCEVRSQIHRQLFVGNGVFENGFVGGLQQGELLLLLFSLPYEDCGRLLASIEQSFYARHDGARVSLSHELAVLDAYPPTHKEDAC